MAVLWFVIFVQFALIVWLVYDKFKTKTVMRRRGASVDD